MIFVSSNSWPHPTGSGNAVLCWGLIHVCRELGFEPTIVPVSIREAQNTHAQKRECLRDHGFRIVEESALLLATPPDKIRRGQRKLWSLNRQIIPRSAAFEKQLQKLATDENMQFALGYSWEALGLLQALGLPKIASVVDLVEDAVRLHLQDLKKNYRQHFFRRVSTIVHAARRERLSMHYLSQCDMIIEHAAQYAEYLKEKHTNVHHVPHPLMPKDKKVIARIKKARKQSRQGDVIRILVPGSLKGQSSQRGFELLEEKILPILKTKIGQRFEIRIAGHGTMPDYLQERFSAWPEVTIVGFVKDLETEYERADVLLVTIPLSKGFRTRIAEAFSYKLCVVAHRANVAGMPEIIDKKNALLGDNAQELADALISIQDNFDRIEALGEGALQTFEDSYSVKSAVEKLRAPINALVAQHR